MALTDEQKQLIENEFAQGSKPSEIATRHGLPGRSVSGYCRSISVADQGGLPQANLSSPGVAHQAASSVVGELVEGIERLDELGEKRASRQAPPPGAANPVETVKEAVEIGVELARGNGNGQGELLPFLSTLVTQQEKSSQAIISQLNTQHTNALDRMKEDHRLRMEELDKKFEREKERDKDYWARIETAREKADNQRRELDKEERKLITDRLNSVDEQVTKNLEHANRLIEEREKSSDRYIDMTEKFSSELAELRKEMGKGDGTQELVKHAIERLGEPIIKAIEKRGGNNEPAALGTGIKTATKEGGKSMGLFGDKVKQAILGQLKPYITKAAEQARKHLQKWPEVSMRLLVDLLWSWRMYTDVGGYVQTAITFIVLNDLDELVAEAGEYLTGDLRKLLATPKAKKWWTALQNAINMQVKQDEQQAQAAYDAYTGRGEKQEAKE